VGVDLMATGYGQPVAPSGPPPPPPQRVGWTAGRTVLVILGSLLSLFSLGLLAAGGTALWADQTQRDNGYISTNSTTFTTDGYALASHNLHLWGVGQSLLGTVHIRFSGLGGGAVFGGIAPSNQVNTYLSGVQFARVDDFTNGAATVTTHSGGAPATTPAAATIWTAKASGPGTQTLTWKVRGGEWTVVAMNADGSRPVSIRADIGVRVPWLIWAATGLLIAGAILLAGGIVLIVAAVRRASRPREGTVPS
jgi:hypothetical protein